MIVLDEHILDVKLRDDIAQWYPGAVCWVTDLRPGTVIKDEQIPGLLRQQRQPTFVTINERDFWLRTQADKSFCAICFRLTDLNLRDLPSRLRQVLSLPMFSTKTRRMGHVIRVTTEGVSYYTSSDRQVKALNW